MKPFLKSSVSALNIVILLGIVLIISMIHFISTNSEYQSKTKYLSFLSEYKIFAGNNDKQSINVNEIDEKTKEENEKEIEEEIEKEISDENEEILQIIQKENSKVKENTKKYLFSQLKIPEKDAVNMSAKMFPNMPVEFWKSVEHKRDSMFFSSSSCSPFPSIYELDVHNTYWQTLMLSDKTLLQLYSAHYDNREIRPGKDVRILSMVNRTSDIFTIDNYTIFCQFWFEDEDQPVVVPMNKLDYLWLHYWGIHQDGTLGPYLLGCSIPQSHEGKIPKVVSIVEKYCNPARNMLAVTYKPLEEKKEFAVCVKGLDFFQNDLSFRLVEWIEFVLRMGVDKIFFYRLELHPNMTKVLNYYEELGKVEVTDITLPNGNVNLPFLQHEYLVHNNYIQILDEIIPYNDCLYRNLHSYDYIGIFDIDEIIVPLEDDNWHDLIERAKEYEESDTLINAFIARHMLYLDSMEKEGPYPDFPPYMHMMQHVYRSENYTEAGACTKTIFSTQYTISCHNHWPIASAPDTVSVDFDLEDGRVQHYRHVCPVEVNQENEEKAAVKDPVVWRFKDSVVPAVIKTLEKLGFIKN